MVDLQTRHIRAFVEIVETGSIRTAATVLGISQPALTKTVQELERQLGVQLLVRTVHGSVPTEYGKVFFSRARFIGDELQRAQSEIEQMRGMIGGTTFVGMSSIASLLIARNAIEQFRRTHSDKKLSIAHGLFDQLTSGVRFGRFDLAVGGLPPEQFREFVEIEPLFKSRIVPVVRKGHPLEGARSISELVECEWVLTNDEPSFIRILSGFFERHHLNLPRIAVACESVHVVLDLVTRSDLVGVLPENIFTLPELATNLSVVEVEERWPESTVALMIRVGVPLTPMAAHFAQALRQAAHRINKCRNLTTLSMDE